MAATVPILQAVVSWLQDELPDAEVRLFPDDPATYRFIHPKGAVLVGYQGSKFGRIEQLGAISQQRVITLHLTVFGRGLHNDGAALDLLDRLRLAVAGYQPPHCLPCHLISEQFLSENAGSWQYQLLVQTETHQVQQCRAEQAPLFTAARYRRDGQPPEPDLKPRPKKE
ncbi:MULTISPECIES: Gp37 family protein [unclassified Neisseria]|uniref:Gp37 family protein n=1 Tax=unclassified Neisseria TaxID=2623750 RepID=UPI0010716477|nr:MULTISPECIES: Gp37 family protein [unclassified Neisseria]MBF0802906.1 hypothetical protein [Neisseria sp. 19428wB4_WF04]TFU44441.1 hypothetical protein E4T99_00740 [Neisseria sp. WF04]